MLNLVEHPRTEEVLRALVRISESVIENSRPTTTRKPGFGWEELKAINPRIVYCAICGFGHNLLPICSGRPSYDMVAQTHSKLMSITGPEWGLPCRVRSSTRDSVTRLKATIGILVVSRICTHRP